MKQFQRHERLNKIILIFIGILAGIIISEVSLYAIFLSGNDYYVWHPYLSRTFKPLPHIMPGIEGESRFIVNSEGIRGDELSSEHTYRILTIGGSTTENAYLDQYETWQYLLQKELNNNKFNHRVWIGNVGKSGINTRHHIVQLRYLLERYQDIDAVIILIGVNDLAHRLAKDVNYEPNFLNQIDSEKDLLPQIFSILPLGYKKAQPFYKRMAIWHLLRKIKYFIFPVGQIQDETGRGYVEARQNRRKAVVLREDLPDLTSALEEYSRNINTIVDLCEAKSVRLIFMTQPVLWDFSLSEELRNLLSFGWVENPLNAERQEYYSVDALARGIERYNETLLKVCKDRQVEYIDLARLLPKDTTVFFDDCHFNENGAEKVAKILSMYMLKHDPFVIFKDHQ